MCLVLYYIGHVYNKPRYMWIVLYKHVHNKPCYMQLVLYYIGMYTKTVLHLACVVLSRHVYNNISNRQSKTTNRVICVFVVLYRHVYIKMYYIWLVLYSIGMYTANSIPCGLCCII